MVDEFLQSFLTISDYRTVIFLAVLAVLFWAIHYLYRIRKMDFSLVVVIGMVLGALLGLSMQVMSGFSDTPMKVTFVKETTTWFQLFGNGYIDLIKMIVVPLVIISIAHVIVNMDTDKGNRSFGQTNDSRDNGYGCCIHYRRPFLWYSLPCRR